MSIAKTFFVREIVRLRRNIADLERGLNGRTPNDPRSAGQRAMIDNEMKCRELLLDLAAEASDLPALQMALRIRYGVIKRAHERACRQQSGAYNAASSDDWWDSLGQMQYLCHLSERLSELERAYTPQERQQELRRATRARDLSAAAERAELLHAMTLAEGSATAKAALVRDDVPRAPADDDT